MTNYKIDIVSDTVCPWCYVGKNRLDKAIEAHKQTNPSDTFSTTWYPFYLNPDAPKSVDKQSYYEKKFGAQRTQVMQGHLARLGSQVGINFAFGGRTGNTRDSHRLVQLAKTKGEGMQTKVIEQLFNAYFEVNEDITDQEVLIQRGIKAGLDEQEVRDWMVNGKGGPEVDKEVAMAQQKFVTGVPNFTINGKYEVQGAEEPAAFLQIFGEVKDTVEGQNGSKVGGENGVAYGTKFRNFSIRKLHVTIMTSISSVERLTLDLPPACIAFCPTEPEYFVIGTYHLHRKENQADEDSGEDASGSPSSQAEQQKRSGTLELFRMQGEQVIHIATEPTPDYSILDIQWTPHHAASGPVLAVAASTGLLVFYRFAKSREAQHLIHISSERICEPETLVLSLAWHPKDAKVIGLTLSDGRAVVCRARQGDLWAGDQGIEITTVFSHSLEAWWLAFSPSYSGALDLYSGGDDQLLQRTVEGEEPEQCTSLWQDRRIHQAGVTYILPLSRDLILTGSYDDHIRLISAPAVGRRQVLAEANLGGGVWRIKPLSHHPSHEQDGGENTASGASTALSGTPEVGSERGMVILASCMYAGTRVLRLSRQASNGQWQFEILGRFEEHQSMNYASDVQPQEGDRKLIVSTSFYDKLLCLWHFDLGTGA
ncbi:WD40 repeat-like protein [Hortaea werneckii]|nr:WD40 repeat-like protein [Hortaea werneckii]KAI7575553.1 WD40 repeat-like protein [Hortaea werneckii]